MSSLKIAGATVQSNFDLKNTTVDLVWTKPTAKRAHLSIDELEAKRTAGRGIPASKHGLELICGASCDTGAQ